MKTKELQLIAEKNRKRLVEVVFKAKAGHIGGDLSCLNVMTALYFHVMNIDRSSSIDHSPLTIDHSSDAPANVQCSMFNVQSPEANVQWQDRDRFVLSKGHCVESLYVTLEAKGFLQPEILDTLGQFGSILSGHPTIEVPGIEVNSGALGHGLSIGLGMALAAKMDGKDYHTYVLMGDGEQGEGSIYEAAMAANRYHLDNLVAIIDRNHLQISGNTEDVMPLDSIYDRWTAFGWDVKEMNGDSMESIVNTFDSIDYHLGKPHLLVSQSTKGFGVSFMEGVAKWHHGVLNAEQCEAAVKEIEERINRLINIEEKGE
ncbi:MAG: transketolase [Prevotella sp.]|nr:transketolase [Prevotella sp.]